MAKQHNAFTNHEVEIIRKHWPTAMPREQIIALLPRHTYDSVKQYASQRLKLKRCSSPWWEPLRDLLSVKPRTKTEIAAAFGVSAHCAGEIIAEYHGTKVYIKSYDIGQGKGRAPARWAIGNEPDAPPPISQRRRAKSTVNPFAVAAGLVDAPKVGQVGRVFAQPMEVENWRDSRELEEA